MEAYEAFAQVYDLFMDDVPYEEWASYLLAALRRYGIRDGLVLDLGCGTGRMTRLLADAGYDMIGVDASSEMLIQAMEEPSDGILYLQQDMREFELYGTVRAIISACDCLNYILEPQELGQVFFLAANYLDPGGLFLFDMNTLYKYQEMLGERTFAESREEAAFIWENYYDETARINEYELTLFVRQEDELFTRFQEVHRQRAYEVQEIADLLQQASFEILSVTDAYTGQPFREDSERVLFMARVNKQGGIC